MTDAERIDWLEAHHGKIYDLRLEANSQETHDLNGVPFVFPRWELWTAESSAQEPTIHCWGNSIREVIDAAITKGLLVYDR